MNANVLITGAGGAAAISFLNAVRDEISLDYFMGDIDPYAAGLYLVNDENRLLLPRANSPEFVDELLDICQLYQIDVLVPTVDMELLQISESIKLFEEIGIKVLIANTRTLKICLDKNELMNHCAGKVSLPWSAILDSDFDEEGLRYPVFIKPRTGAGSRGIKKINSAKELARIKRDGSMLIQEYLTGLEYSVDVFADKFGKVKAAVPRERLKVDSGIAVAGRSVKDARLENEAIEVAKAIGLTYTANIQFKRDRNGEPKLLEVNPRFPGTMPLTVKSGVNMPFLSLKELLDLNIDESEFEWIETAVVRTWQEHFVSSDDIAKLEMMVDGSDFRIAA